jgi:hypothetical protein
MAKTLMERLGVSEAELHGEFTPYCYYNEDADCLHVQFQRGQEISKRLNSFVTLLIAVETGDLLGCIVKGVSDIAESLPNYIDVKHGGDRLKILFFAYRAKADTSEEKQTIDRLSQSVGEMRLPEDLMAC